MGVREEIKKKEEHMNSEFVIQIVLQSSCLLRVPGGSAEGQHLAMGNMSATIATKLLLKSSSS